MTTPNIAVNDAWGTMFSGGLNAGNELMPDAGTDFMSVMKGTVKDQMPKVEEGVSAPVKTEEKRAVPETKTDKKATEKKTEDTDSSTGRESRDAKVESREAQKTAKDTSKTEAKDEVNDEARQTVVSKVEEVKINIISQLGITLEDLEKAMEILNIETVDLLNPQTVPELVSELTGEDISAVLTDEDLYAKVSDITGMIRQNVSEVMQTLDQTVEEFEQTLETIRQEPVRAQAYEEPQIETPVRTEEPEQIPAEDKAEGFEKVKIEVSSSLKDVVRTPAEADPEEKTETDVTERKSVTGETETGDKSIEITGKVSEGREIRQETKGDHRDTDPRNNNNNTNQTFIQNLTQSVNDVAAGVENAEDAAQPYVRAEQILDQIENGIKVGISEDATSMELQLHPASLGKINVKLVSANGEVTAQFEAQNASVKAALEGHVAQLKQTLQSQGVKIESVEVTIASHEFEQNLMQGQEGNAQDANGGKRSGLRRINLGSDDDEEIEGVAGNAESEAERIARSMMAANGTSVDFQA